MMFKCSECGGPSRLVRINKMYEKYGFVLVVKNIPCFMCENCGEKHYTFETLDQLDELVSAWKQAVDAKAAEDQIVVYKDAA